MMITKDDIDLLAMRDRKVSEELLEDYLSQDAASGITVRHSYVLGLLIGGELFVDHFMIRKGEEESLFEELRSTYAVVRFILPLDNANLPRVFMFYDAGLEIECGHGPCKVQMTLISNRPAIQKSRPLLGSGRPAIRI